MTGSPAAAGGALSVEAVGVSMRFGDVVALDDVSVRVEAGTMHALLGENGAGKSTFVKCLMGFHRMTAGQIVVGSREVEVRDPRAAHAHGLGMVYQHFTLVPSLSGAENLVISRERVPTVIDWQAERAALARFVDTMPFTAPLDVPVQRLAAGERQKLEILKQLYLGRRFLILDEPTSVLTPGEADELLGTLRDLTRSGRLTVLMITHKLREVSAFAHVVSVLRQGRHVGTGRVADLDHGSMAAMMIGEKIVRAGTERGDTVGSVGLRVQDLRTPDRTGRKEIAIDSLSVRSGEIVGIAGISGNGQTELMEVLTGQRRPQSGGIRIDGRSYVPSRAAVHATGVRCLPEEPLRNACASRMSLAENLAFRTFDRTVDGRRRFWLDRPALRSRARDLAARFRIHAASVEHPMASLSGGNVQRAVLARELTGTIRVLIVANPCFGLDFAAVAEVRSRILTVRNSGAAVLLISEDLDEILELADRILVMSEGRIVHETARACADAAVIGRHMAGRP